MFFFVFVFLFADFNWKELLNFYKLVLNPITTGLRILLRFGKPKKHKKGENLGLQPILATGMTNY